MNRDDLRDLLLLAVACVLVVGPDALVPGGPALGRPTRDLFDHLALLDAWFVRTRDWAWPTGGALVAPDLHGMLLSAPFVGVDRAWAYNLSVVARLWLACACAWALCRRTGGSALVGAAAFGLCPFLVGQAWTGEAETLSVWPFPAVAALLLGGRPVAAGFVATVGALGSWYYGAFLGVGLLAWAVARYRDLGGAACVPLVTFVGTVALPAWLFAGVLASPDELFRAPDMAAYLSEHPRALATMVSDPAAWLGAPAPDATHDDRLGVAIVLFAAVGLAFRRGRVAALALVGVGLLLAVGPVLHVGGEPITTLTPYRMLSGLPVFGLMRLPHRWLIVAALGLAVLAARGASALPRAGALLILLETTLFGARASTLLPEPPSPPPDGPVLDLPPRTLGREDARGIYLVWQREHRQPVPYSLSMSGWSPWMAEEPLVIALAALDGRDRIGELVDDASTFRQRAFAERVAAADTLGVPEARLAGARERLGDQGIAEVRLHLGLLDAADQPAALDAARAALGEPDVAEPLVVRWRLAMAGP